MVIVVGDFNIDMYQTNKKIAALQNFMQNLNPRFLLDKETKASTSLIDHAWSNISTNYHTFMSHTYWSDHNAICLLLEETNANKS